jgi:serpin B
MKTILFWVLASLAGVILSCAGNGSEITAGNNSLMDYGPGTKVVAGNILKSTTGRDTTSAPAQDIASVAEANNAFAWTMFEKLFDRDANLIFSPYSISTALSMAAVGTRGESGAEMRRALRWPFDGIRFHGAMNSMDLQMESRGQGASGREATGFSLMVDNALWGEQTMKFSVAFLDTLVRFYDAGMGLCDFVGNPDAARLRINGWISGRTNDKIRDMLNPGSIDNMTRLVITNTVYFDAAWADTFEHDKTFQGWFYRSSGDSMQVPFMNRIGSYNYSENERFQALELPYDGGQVAMVVLLPKDTSLRLLENVVNDTVVRSLSASFVPKIVAVSLPKFSFTYGTVFLNRPLQEMGMRMVFTDLTDFSGICDSPLFISSVLHKAYIAVDEKGTTAAAATVVVIDGNALHPYDVRFSADHPFILLIRHIPTGQALFVGYVAEPKNG